MKLTENQVQALKQAVELAHDRAISARQGASEATQQGHQATAQAALQEAMRLYKQADALESILELSGYTTHA